MPDSLDEVCSAIRKLREPVQSQPIVIQYETIDPGRMGDNMMKPGPYVPHVYEPEGSQPLDMPCFPGDKFRHLNVSGASLPHFVDVPPHVPYRMDLPIQNKSAF